jgi:hypothetical protein
MEEIFNISKNLLFEKGGDGDEDISLQVQQLVLDYRKLHTVIKIILVYHMFTVFIFLCTYIHLPSVHNMYV